MKEISGTSGRVAIADLNSGEVRVERIPEAYRRDYIGGKGLALKYFMEMRGDRISGIDPLGEDNLLCFFAGVMTGTGAVCSARFSGLTLSPLTGLMVHASCGGPFGSALKTAGYDGLIITGKASSPVVLELGDPELDAGKLSDGSFLFGMGCGETQERLKLGKGDGALVIGPAGEHLVRYANIASGHRYLGRGGMGAVMGAKNLKAVVARGGSYEVKVADPRLFASVKKRSIKYINRNPFTLGYRKYGTAFNLRPGIAAGFLPVRNFRDRTDPRADVFSGEAMAERYNTKPSTCRPCTILCGHKGTYPDGKVRQIPEYETVGLMGPNLDIWDPDIVGVWNETANRLGMDTITLGATLSWAMEAAEKGLRPSRISFGDTDAIGAIIEDIAFRRGEGDELAEGSRNLSEKYGGTDYAIHVKGMELAAYDPRAAWGQGLNYAVANRGGCHLNAFPIGLEVIFGFLSPLSKRAKAKWVDYFENVYTAVNSLQTCQFSASAYVLEPFIAKRTPKPLLGLAMTWLPRLSRLGLDWSVFSDYYQSITGIPTSSRRLLLCGRRVHILERHMNTLRGVSVDDDRLPERFLRGGMPIASMVQEYYREKGYDRRGIPTGRVLRKLGIVPVDSGTGGRKLIKRVRPVSRPFATAYCGLILWFLGRAAAAASRHDDETAREFEGMPEGFSFALQVSGHGPAMVLGRNGKGKAVYLGGASFLRDNPPNLVIRIKTLSAAVLLFTFRESTATSQARERLVADGPIPETCGVVRILNRLETIILPKVVAVRAVKRYRKPEKLGRKRGAVYFGALFAGKGDRS
jgi:aldehyde:ferredoxin oxidoreductase